MKLTHKKAIALCIELWTWLAKTGKLKEDWPKWEKYGAICQYCWFCEYDTQQKERYGQSKYCIYCPLVRILRVKCESRIEDNDTFYEKWENAKTPHARKKYAGLFLKQIKSIEQRSKS